jgi:D-serine dehydratase
MTKLVFSSRRQKDIFSLIAEAETSNRNPDVNFWIAPDGAEITSYKYPNGLWKKEIVKGSTRINRYSAKINNKIVMTETVERLINAEFMENISVEVMNMFSQYSHSKLYIKD